MCEVSVSTHMHAWLFMNTKTLRGFNVCGFNLGKEEVPSDIKQSCFRKI